MEDIMFYSQELYLPAGCFDICDNLRPASVLELFQDAAGRHADMLGSGYEDMKAAGKAWVLMRVCYHIDKMPDFGSRVTVSTWPRQGRLDFDRYYLITSPQGEVLVRGSSKWCVIDLASRRLLREPGIIYPGQGRDSADMPCAPRLRSPENGEKAGELRALPSRLDHNGHMNNARYADAVQDALAPGETIEDFAICYEHELAPGDCAQVYSCREDASATVWGVRSDGCECFTARACIKKP